MKKHLKELVKLLESADIRVESMHQGSKHWKLKLSGCSQKMTVSSTPKNSHQSKQNALRTAKKLIGVI